MCRSGGTEFGKRCLTLFGLKPSNNNYFVFIWVHQMSLFFLGRGGGAPLLRRRWSNVPELAANGNLVALILNPLAAEFFFFLILAHTVYEMCIKQEPKKLAL